MVLIGTDTIVQLRIAIDSYQHVTRLNLELINCVVEEMRSPLLLAVGIKHQTADSRRCTIRVHPYSTVPLR